MYGTCEFCRKKKVIAFVESFSKKPLTQSPTKACDKSAANTY